MGKRVFRLGILAGCLATTAFAQTSVILDTFSDVRDDPRFQGADLVVVGHVTVTRETGEETTLPETSFPAAGLESAIAVQAVLKGDPLLRRVILHHYRLDVNYRVVGGPSLLRFDTRTPIRYVFFLKREEDGRYAPAKGQTNSAFSVTVVQPSARLEPPAPAP